jgi:hypothetical protein
MSDNVRYGLAAALGVVAIIAMSLPDNAAPPPDDHPARLVLAGKFVGPTASSDAACVSCLCDELARIIEADGRRAEPRLRTGVSFDDLRTTARDMRTEGQSIGERQPKARDEICHFLNEAVGISGGPITPEQRAKWVDALFEISRAANNAAQ